MPLVFLISQKCTGLFLNDSAFVTKQKVFSSIISMSYSIEMSLLNRVVNNIWNLMHSFSTVHDAGSFIAGVSWYFLYTMLSDQWLRSCVQVRTMVIYVQWWLDSFYCPSVLFHMVPCVDYWVCSNYINWCFSLLLDVSTSLWKFMFCILLFRLCILYILLMLGKYANKINVLTATSTSSFATWTPHAMWYVVLNLRWIMALMTKVFIFVSSIVIFLPCIIWLSLSFSFACKKKKKKKKYIYI